MVASKNIALSRVIGLLPPEIGGEILRIMSGRRGGGDNLREITLRRDGVSSILLGDERIPLYHRLCRDGLDRLTEGLIGGALYARRDEISEGYISLEGGVRVGICGYATYDGGRLVGIGDMRSLVFRIPTGGCSFIDELVEIFSRGIGCGMLIYSPPGVGKTTALRTLAARLGRGKNPLHICVVDERCEFSAEDYSSSAVDLLRGYKRREGIEIATRTLSPDLIMMDEIGADDGENILSVVRCGVPIIATAHASDTDEIMARQPLRRLISCGAFSVLVGISRRGGEYLLREDRVDDLLGVKYGVMA